MKISGVMAGVLLLGGVGLAGQAAAACSGTALDVTQLSAKFSGNTVCAQRAGDRGHRPVDGPVARARPLSATGSAAVAPGRPGQ